MPNYFIEIQQPTPTSLQLVKISLISEIKLNHTDLIA